ncbi:hypothetical protein [Celeribacter sp.]
MSQKPETKTEEAPLSETAQMLLKRAAKLIDPNRKETDNDC